MPYKDYEDTKKAALEYYYRNKKKALAYQKERWKRKYREDSEFRKKRQFRDKSRKGKKKINEPCYVCGSTKDLQRHHPSYKKITNIILCRTCHNKTHNSLKIPSHPMVCKSPLTQG